LLYGINDREKSYVVGCLPLLPKLIPFLKENTSGGSNLHSFESSAFESDFDITSSLFESVLKMFSHYIPRSLSNSSLSTENQTAF
jgi:hypothetical protein